MKCTNCGKEIVEDAIFCQYCRAQVLDFDRCSKCGGCVPKESKFCPYCGCNHLHNEKNMENKIAKRKRRVKNSDTIEAIKELKRIAIKSGIIVAIEFVMFIVCIIIWQDYDIDAIKFFVGVLYCVILYTSFKATVKISNIEKINFFLRFLPMLLLVPISFIFCIIILTEFA